MAKVLRIFNNTSEFNIEVNNRKKRDTVVPSSDNTFDWDEFNSINFNDEQLQKAREIIMKHDILCSEEDKQGICKDLVAKLRAITAKNVATKKEETTKITLENNDIDVSNKSKHSEAEPTDVAKREVLPQAHLGHVDTVPKPFVAPINVSQHDYPHNCLMNLLKRYPRQRGKACFTFYYIILGESLLNIFIVIHRTF